MKTRIKLLLCALVASIGVTAAGSAEPASAMPMSCYQIETAIFFLEGKYTYFEQSRNELYDYVSARYFDSDRAEWMVHVYYTNPWSGTWIDEAWTVPHYTGENIAIFEELSDIHAQRDALEASLNTCV